ncbi:Histidine acid phosphatase family protein [Trichomonas vaginalis G3]|uniref:Histidine acid phosphatase family protein n=1 Tax=Trichomonas vaginalis (strain ATCC PRA-98 / G3) TaxID=412133 RepID=A2DJ55_TRIV3|nr:histidine acid phosphatase [Trichomonas vaginalis G3]EAY19630.1 Histidine acid phosphatase family protein [Trichomonas vaginalis G3]KAI5515070.1 acid phosphatase protein [Trichomonas vaginalis G3]|eukprot:XP_001580616.1 histidine acid phosphatase [Trichomonas vaginalis G3]
MIPFLFSLGFSIHPSCKAPTKFPEPLNSSFIPKYAQILLRHGARTPIVKFLSLDKRGVWQCDSADAYASRIEAAPLVHPRRIRRILDQRLAEFPANCQMGDLTVEGMTEHAELGAAFNKYIVNQLKLLPDYLDPTLIQARATWYERTYHSCISFLKGLYPIQDPNEVVDITVGTKDFDVVHPTKDMCPDLADLRNRYFNSDDYKQIYNEVLPVAEPLYTFTNTSDKSPEGLEKICDWAITYYCNEQDLTEIITDDLVAKCRKLQIAHFYKLNFFDKEKLAIGAAPIFREIFRVMDQSLNEESTTKLNIISAHDSVIAFVLSALGIGNDFTDPPPYASYIVMEVYMLNQEPYVRFIYNGEVLDLGDGQQVMKLHNFRQKLDPYLQQCLTLP